MGYIESSKPAWLHRETLFKKKKKINPLISAVILSLVVGKGLEKFPPKKEKGVLQLDPLDSCL
jgi:hypothetical protein